MVKRREDFCRIIINNVDMYAIFINMGTVGETVNEEEFTRDVYNFYRKYFAEASVDDPEDVLQTKVVSEYEAGIYLLNLAGMGYRVIMFNCGEIVEVR